jgi:hypothetical protein
MKSFNRKDRKGFAVFAVKEKNLAREFIITFV